MPGTTLARFFVVLALLGVAASCGDDTPSPSIPESDNTEETEDDRVYINLSGAYEAVSIDGDTITGEPGDECTLIWKRLVFHDQDPDPRVEEGFTSNRFVEAKEGECISYDSGFGTYLATIDSIIFGSSNVVPWIETREKFESSGVVYVKDHECDELRPCD